VEEVVFVEFTFLSIFVVTAGMVFVAESAVLITAPPTTATTEVPFDAGAEGVVMTTVFFNGLFIWGKMMKGLLDFWLVKFFEVSAAEDATAGGLEPPFLLPLCTAFVIVGIQSDQQQLILICSWGAARIFGGAEKHHNYTVH
jgi:hypothetical protein